MQLTDPIGTPTPERKSAAADKSGARELGIARNSSDPPPRKSLSLGVVIAEKYRLERLLRRGGMGSVWVATHLGLQSPVAIKFMASRLAPDDASSGDEGSRARFEREASAAARLRMANIVQVLDYGVDNDVPYLVMELLEGEDLGARLQRIGKMPVSEAAKVVTAVARALQRAHDMGLVHRDLKPENIFLAKEGDDEVPKILDFGVAKAIQGGDIPADSSTSEGTVIGTPFYISPEQAVGRTDIDHRSDLWSLGVITYRMITGERPFKSELLLEVVVEICSAPIAQPTTIVPELPPSADAFIEKALAREPENRFASAKELAAALAEVADGGLKSKAASRKRLWIALAVLFVVADILAIGWAARTPLSSGEHPQAPPSGTGAVPPPPSVATPPERPSALPPLPTAPVTAAPSAPAPGDTASPRPKGTAGSKSTSQPVPKTTATGKGREVGY